ncbi:hypothetical protein EIN_238530 [Entamoeba invadens IP1]|uniref:TLDc domain-containing protein n=1 Tax=Entamoeba invadens IP1 TaxID=370355 RepID=A0A0A1UFT4_ENTIV|nr:hypothetical protein EIN_238530 [Entamoeba invadens IP1]ELP93623.1 hypothetical protein EIN_238530 [Entamoeba invadens IP1]|eukprot:XP_004260394.1 hypothetical protein EIN_238530 [Entamoeba invadens IP1]
MGSSVSHILIARNVHLYSKKCKGNKDKQEKQKMTKKNPSKKIKESNDYVSESTTTLTKEQEMIKSLLKKTKSEQIEVIYNSDLLGFEQREIRTKILGEQNIIFLVMTESGSIFGFYQKDMINNMKCCKQLKATSKDFFLFGSPYVYQNLYFYKRKEQIENKDSNSFTLYEDENNLVLSCYSSFWIKKNKQIEFNVCKRIL